LKHGFLQPLKNGYRGKDSEKNGSFKTRVESLTRKVNKRSSLDRLLTFLVRLSTLVTLYCDPGPSRITVWWWRRARWWWMWWTCFGAPCQGVQNIKYATI